MAGARASWSTGGKVALGACAFALAAAALWPHPLPALALGFLGALLLLALPGRGPLERLELLALPPAWLVEDEERVLEATYRLKGRRSPLALRLRTRGPAAHVDGAAPALAPTELGRITLRVRARKRGHHTRIPLTCSARGLLGWRPLERGFELPADLWVLPRPRALRERVLEEMLALRPRGLDLPQPTGPGEGEFYALRHFRPGDPERRVHARLSARLARKVIRVFRGEAPPHVDLVVDPRVGRAAEAFGSGDFDEAMRFAAGVVRSLLQRNVPVSLSIVEMQGTRLAVDARTRDLHAYLAALALARPLACERSAAPLVLPGGERAGRRVLLHLGLVEESRLPPDVIAIRAGSRRYYQLLDRPWSGSSESPRAR